MEKENKAKMVTEHKRLVKVLMSGDRIAQMNEAKKQSKELSEMLKEGGKKSLAIKGLI